MKKEITDGKALFIAICKSIAEMNERNVEEREKERGQPPG